MITHYGLFWSERVVFWGRQNTPGQLLGRERKPLQRRGAPTKAERGQQKDYRDFVGVYCLYRGRDLIYVGEAGLGTKRNLFDRLKGHRDGYLAGIWDHFSWFGRQGTQGECKVKEALAQLEAVAIAIINPGFNRQSGTFEKAVQVFQVPHPESEGDLETKVNLVYDMVKEMKDRHPEVAQVFPRSLPSTSSG